MANPLGYSVAFHLYRHGVICGVLSQVLIVFSLQDWLQRCLQFPITTRLGIKSIINYLNLILYIFKEWKNTFHFYLYRW